MNVVNNLLCPTMFIIKSQKKQRLVKSVETDPELTRVRCGILDTMSPDAW